MIISFSSKNKMNLKRGGRKRRKKEKREKSNDGGKYVI